MPVEHQQRPVPQRSRHQVAGRIPFRARSPRPRCVGLEVERVARCRADARARATLTHPHPSARFFCLSEEHKSTRAQGRNTQADRDTRADMPLQQQRQHTFSHRVKLFARGPKLWFRIRGAGLGSDAHRCADSGLMHTGVCGAVVDA
eukprot:222090-Rhodomonas_salina.1